MPPRALDGANLGKLLSAAAAAPSLRPAQRWRYRLDVDSTTLEVRAVTAHRAEHALLPARALHVSVGAAVFHLRVAAAHFGWRPVVRLLPRPEEPGLLATVHLGGPAAPGAGVRADLYDVVWRRPAGRPAGGRRPPPVLLAELAAAARAEGALLAVPPPGEAARLLRHAVEGAVPPAPGPAAQGGRSPLLAVLATESDGPLDWLRTGQALAHVLLTATAHGVRTTLLQRAVECLSLRSEVSTGGPSGTSVQILIRLGHWPEPTAPPRHPRPARRDGCRTPP